MVLPLNSVGLIRVIRNLSSGLPAMAGLAIPGVFSTGHVCEVVDHIVFVPYLCRNRRHGEGDPSCKSLVMCVSETKSIRGSRGCGRRRAGTVGRYILVSDQWEIEMPAKSALLIAS